MNFIKNNSYNPLDNKKEPIKIDDDLKLNTIKEQFQLNDYNQYKERNLQTIEYIINHRSNGYLLFL